MFREIRTSEKITEKDQKNSDRELGYMKIKPEKLLTTKELMEEVNKFWDEEFAKVLI